MAVTFYFNNGIFQTGSGSIVENHVKSHRAASAKLILVLDMEKFEASGVFPEIIKGIVVGTNAPVKVNLEENVFWNGVLKHIIVCHLSFNVHKLVLVVMVSELDALSCAFFAYFVVIVAINFELFQG